MTGPAGPVGLRSVTVDAKVRRRLVVGWARERAVSTLAVSLLASALVVLFFDAGRHLVAWVVAVPVTTIMSFGGLSRRVRRRHPLGSVIAAAVDDEALRLVIDGVDWLVHLGRAEYRGVRGGVVRLRVLGVRMLIPRDALDDAELDRLGRGAPLPGQGAGLLSRAAGLGGGSMLPEDVGDMRRLVWRLNAFRPVTSSIALVGGAFAVVIIVTDGDAFGWVVLIVLGVTLLEPLAGVVRARAGIPSVGDILVGDVAGDHWVVATTTSFAAVPLSALRHVDRYRGLVVFHWIRPVPHTSFPVRLLSPTAWQRLPQLGPRMRHG